MRAKQLRETCCCPDRFREQLSHWIASRLMRRGVLILPEFRWSTAEPPWRRADELGFDHAWTYDHLAWRSLRDSTWFGAIPTLTAAAMATQRIRLGPLVASPYARRCAWSSRRG